MAGEIQIGGTTFATESGGTVTVSNVDSAANRQNLGLEIGVDVQSFDADTTKNDVANTFTANQIISVTDNTNAALRVTQLGTGDALVIEDSTNPDSTPFVVDSSGNVLVGTTSNEGVNGITFNPTTAPGIIINKSFSGTANAIRFWHDSSQVGYITYSNTATAYITSSDYRLKENITEITDGISRVKQLNPSRFNFIADPDKIVDGFIAHEVQDIVPEAVSGEKDAVNEDGSIDPQGIDQSKLVPLLTAALQEAITLIESQQSQIDALTTKTQEQDLTIASLISRIEALETT